MTLAMTRPKSYTAHLTVFPGLGLLTAGIAACILAGCATTECPPCKEAEKTAATVQIIKPLKQANWSDLPGWSDVPALLAVATALPGVLAPIRHATVR